MRLEPDPDLRSLDGGRVLVGGWPVRLVRLGPAAARQVRSWRDGAPVVDRPGQQEQQGQRALARRLLEAGLFHPRPAGGPSPADVTVVIPVRDCTAELARCLEGLPGQCPTIVVDDGSADPAAVRQLAEAAGARRVRREASGGPAAARNAGLAAATTDFVAFVDSDCVPHPGWVGELLAHLADPGVGAVAPRIVTGADGRNRRPSQGWLEAYEAASSALDMGPRESIVRPGARVPYVPGAALVVRRVAAGAGFDGDLAVGEDVDFVWRMAAAGWHVRYEPSVTVPHRHRVRLASWFGRRLAYGTSAAPLARRHPGLLPPASMPAATAAAWLVLACGYPLAGAGMLGAATAVVARGLARHGSGFWPLALRLATVGTLRSGQQLAAAARRGWWPVLLPAVVSPRLRLALVLAFVVPPLVEWARKSPGMDACQFLGARLLDDLAYSLGVWAGCYRQRTVQPLVPRFWWRSGSG